MPASQAQESYLLAELEEQEALVGAVMEAALGPSPLDPDMAAQARSMLLLPVFGHTVRRDAGVCGCGQTQSIDCGIGLLLEGRILT